MPDKPYENSQPEHDKGDLEVDLFNRLPATSPFTRRTPTPPVEDDPIEEFWATFAMITHTGERFTLSICFRNRKHYNAEMHKFETAKNMHVVLRDINDEGIVIKRDVLLHVLPDDIQNQQHHTKKW